MKIEKEYANEKIRYETVGSDTVFIKKNVNLNGDINKEKLIEVKKVQELQDAGISTVKDAFQYLLNNKGFKYVERKQSAG